MAAGSNLAETLRRRFVSGGSRGIAVFPGFCDVHVHFREPGFSYKETIATGAAAAAAGGFTDVCTMPNLNPAPDTKEHLEAQLEIIRRGTGARVHPYGTITVGRKGRELADMEGMAADVIGFSDDGDGVQDDDLMLEAMRRVGKLGRIIAAHCEDKSLTRGGVINDGQYAKAHGMPGICAESEWKPVERDLRLAAETGCAYHVCHVSCAESVGLVRQAKKRGINVTCETAPHYLALDDGCLEDDGRFRMNPPLRSESDREALIEGIIDGTVDMIATDHAPHSAEEKSGGLAHSLFGIVGLETSFPAMYTFLVRTGIIPLEKLISLMTDKPRKRFGIPASDKDWTAWDLNACVTVTPETFLSKGRSTPFKGMELYGKCLATCMDGRITYMSEECKTAFAKEEDTHAEAQ